MFTRSTLASGLLLGALVSASACTRADNAPVSTPMLTSADSSSGPGSSCTLVCGGAALAVDTPRTLSPDHHAASMANVNAVFESMHGDLLACYQARVARDRRAHASVVLDLVLEPDGSVRSVTSTGGAMLGDPGLRCITNRVKGATFAPVHNGGTLHVEVPLEFRNVGRDDFY